MANPYVKQTWTDGSGGGTPVSAARLAVIEQGIYDAHICPAVRAYHNANQTITTGVATDLSFNSERFDQDGLGTSTMHDNAVNNLRLTARVAGIYQITGHVRWASNSTGRRRMRFELNGAGTFIADLEHPPASGAATIMCLTTLYDLVVNDYVTIEVTQTSGGNLDVEVGTGVAPEFMMVRVA